MSLDEGWSCDSYELNWTRWNHILIIRQNQTCTLTVAQIPPIDRLIRLTQIELGAFRDSPDEESCHTGALEDSLPAKTTCRSAYCTGWPIEVSLRRALSWSGRESCPDLTTANTVRPKCDPRCLAEPSLGGGRVVGRLRFVIGAVEIIAGFSIYQYGLFMTLNLSPILFAWSETLVPWIGSREAMGAAFQVVGGALAILGLLTCIAWVGSQSKAKALRAVSKQTLQPSVQPVLPQHKCKFCGAAMEPDATFCPKCERAQV